MMKEEYQDIAPYDDSTFRQTMSRLVKEPGFENAIRYVMPDADYHQLCENLLSLNSTEEFQKTIMFGLLEILERKTTSGVTDSGWENLNHNHNVLFISNHRDIVLDASFLGLVMMRKGFKAQEVALGDNLLIYDWIEDLVRINKGIIVKRNLRLTKALEAAKQLSGYIHYCIAEKNESVWLAQREGRAKDSNDVTQESVIKMLSLAGESDNIIDRIKELNITPTAISYEFDPNDVLKAKEFLLKQRDAEFKKSQRDDLLSMETGILQFKGHVHFNIGKCINEELETLRGITDKQEVAKRISNLIDCEIHQGYHIYPSNYIAFDRLEHSESFKAFYTKDDIKIFDDYLSGQTAKIEKDVENITAEEKQFVESKILEMYANPLRNHLSAKEQAACKI